MENLRLVVSQNIDTPPDVEVPEISEFEEFIVRARDSKAKEAANPPTPSVSWAEPDPLAASGLATGRHPITAYLEARRGTVGTT